jgi:hypothetical protein
VAVHERAFEARLKKKLFQFVKQDGLIRPGELLFFQKQEALQDSAEPSRRASNWSRL